MIIRLEIIILGSPEKRAPWKFWLDPRFFRNPKLKWILKWLPLDRGYFKFYFFIKGESILIISCHMTIPISYHTYFKTWNLTHACTRKHKYKNRLIHTKVRNETTSRTCMELFFFAIFCKFPKETKYVSK